jgi:hypothetical protein
MSRKLGDTIIYDFTTHNPLTGAVSDADSTPTCEVFENDTDTPILTPAVTKRTSKTGNYRVPIAATSGNGFAVGRSYNVIVDVTMNTMQAKSCIASFTLDSKRIGDLNDLAQASILSDATPFPGADIALIHAKTTNLPANPASQTNLDVAVSTRAVESTVAKDATVAKEASLAALAKDATVAKDTTVAKDSTVAKDATVAKEATVLLLPVATDTQLSGTHGAGSWEGGVPPTPAEIEAYLATIHGDGSWEKGAEFPV